MQIQNKAVPLHPQSRNNDAQMAESVDALVSNTSGFTSIPVRPRVWVLRRAENHLIFSSSIFTNKQIIRKIAKKRRVTTLLFTFITFFKSYTLAGNIHLFYSHSLTENIDSGMKRTRFIEHSTLKIIHSHR